MCAIAGHPNYDVTVEMLDAMKHRAPDGMNSVSDDKYAIGMGRLKIISTEDIRLPYDKEDLVITFNGEIYNYIELREELKKKGCTFETDTDIEVVLEAYRIWGVHCLRKFNGMFAFAIYDGKKIFLARDIAGEKPLYYRKNPFSFASEAKALWWLCKEFPPAHYAIYDFNSLEIKPYWELEKIKINEETVEDDLEKLLEDAILLRTRSAVPYGLYLSGGVDSTLISTFHDFKHTFTYKDADYKKEFLNVFPKIMWHLDFPVNSFSPFGLWKLAEEASKKVKVVISGEGADELFGGYVRYMGQDMFRQLRKNFPSYEPMFPKQPTVNDLGWQEFNGNLRELLRMGDRMAMAWGIENRCPFLDKRVIEFAFSLPEKYKIEGFNLKVILNNILKKRKPDYTPIEKQGLFVSVNEWIGSKDKYGKKDYKEYQAKVWDSLVL